MQWHQTQPRQSTTEKWWTCSRVKMLHCSKNWNGSGTGISDSWTVAQLTITELASQVSQGRAIRSWDDALSRSREFRQAARCICTQRLVFKYRGWRASMSSTTECGLQRLITLWLFQILCTTAATSASWSSGTHLIFYLRMQAFAILWTMESSQSLSMRSSTPSGGTGGSKPTCLWSNVFTK